MKSVSNGIAIDLLDFSEEIIDPAAIHSAWIAYLSKIIMRKILRNLVQELYLNVVSGL